MSTIFYILITLIVFVAIFFFSKVGFALKKRNEQLIESNNNIAYLKADSRIIIRYVGSEQITPSFFEHIKTGGQEVITEPGNVTFTLSYYNAKGIPGVVKVSTTITEKKVSFQLEAGKAYVIYYSDDNGFFIDVPEKMSWATPLYKKFKQKFNPIIN